MASTGAGSSAAARMGDNNTARLLEMMSFQADVALVFDQAHTSDTDTTVLAHSCILRIHSGVISNALDAEGNAEEEGANSSKRKQVLMPGSLKADFLKVVPFMYPILPLPEVSWENLEVLLVEGRKWDMSVVLAHAGNFIQSNAASLTTEADSKMFAFRWLKLADAAGMADACKACVDKIVGSNPALCTEDRLNGLSPLTLQQFVLRMKAPVNTNVGPIGGTGQRHCNYCGVMRKCMCSSCHQHLP